VLAAIKSSGGTNEWRAAKSKERLETMAYRIKGNHDLKVKQPRFALSASHYREDLAWLRAMYYQPWMGFRWPTLHVPRSRR
jgi:hypothetical protein